jgi:hypothetical protein
MKSADAQLFDDALGCDQSLPLRFVPSVENEHCLFDNASAQVLLRALSQKDQSVLKETDDRDGSKQDIERIEAKMDLLFMLMADIIKKQSIWPDIKPVRWSRFGARFLLNEGHALNTFGMFSVMPDFSVPKLLELPSRIIAIEPLGAKYQIWCRFEQLDLATEMALERHIFRIHRRQVAEARRLVKA